MNVENGSHTRPSAADLVDAGDVSPPAHATMKRWAFRVLNVWLVFHLFAIVVAPASVSPSSSLVRSGWEACKPYLQLLHLNHGYHFFAPEPAASTLVGYTAYREDGTIVSGRIPDREIYPRLLYHRHFMLTEFLTFAPAEQRELVYRTYAGQLCERFDADRVGLARVTHYLPLAEAVLAGAALDDPDMYAEEPLGMFRRGER